jgi:hypothetical protein
MEITVKARNVGMLGDDWRWTWTTDKSTEIEEEMKESIDSLISVELDDKDP